MKDSIENKIRRWRFERNEMTQEELARRAGVTQQTIIAIEQKRFAPSLLLAYRLAHALDVRLDELFLYCRDG